MASAGGRYGAVARQVGRLFAGEAVGGRDEGELLLRFATHRDAAALEGLVTRFGPLVMGVCRRVLSDPHEVEDAFQAVFLVLVKKAGTIRDPDRLGPWLHGVAHRVAVRARADAQKRRRREVPGAEEAAMAAGDGPSERDRSELRAAIDQEIHNLPERFRAPIVLCYLDGLTHDEAAVRLRCPVGTVRSRMATARETLRRRLSRRGVTVTSAAFATLLSAEAAPAAVPPLLLESTIQAVALFSSIGAGAATAGVVSATAASLAEGATTTMMLSKLKILGGAAVATALTLGAGAAAARQFGAGPAQKVEAPKADTDNSKATPESIARLEQELNRSEARLKAASAALEAARQENTVLSAQLQSLKGGAKGAPGRGAGGVGFAPGGGIGGGAPGGAVAEGPVGGGGGGFGRGAVAEGPAAGGGFGGGLGGGFGDGGGGGFGGGLGGGFGDGGGGGFGDGGGGGFGGAGGVNAPGGGFGGASGVNVPAGGVESGGPGGGVKGGGGRGGMGGPAGGGGGMGMGMGGMAGMMGGGGRGFVNNGGKGSMYPEGMIKLGTQEGFVYYRKNPRVVPAYSAETGTWTTYKLPGGVDNIVPIATGRIIALAPRGETITQLAVYSTRDGKWYPVDLKTAASGAVNPVVSGNLAAYVSGRSVYAFSAEARRWDSIELEEGATPIPVIEPNTVTVVNTNRLYTFSAKTGRWADFDSSAALGREEPAKQP